MDTMWAAIIGAVGTIAAAVIAGLFASGRQASARTLVFEDGASEVFAVALFVGDLNVHKRIAKWLEAGRQRGTYADLRGIPGARRIARVDGLRLNMAAFSTGAPPSPSPRS